MFKIGDKVVIKNRPHTTKGCDRFHSDTEVLKKRQIVLCISCEAAAGAYHMEPTGIIEECWWEWNAEDLELWNPQLEND